MNAGETTPAGPGPVTFPARHRLELGLMAAFPSSEEAAAGLLAERGIPGRPARLWFGRTALVVAYQVFTESPVGPYRQVSVSVPVHVPAAGAARAPILLPLMAQALWNTGRVYRDLHFCVVAMPVSTAAAAAYSSTIWGEPAWEAGIDTEVDNAWTLGRPAPRAWLGGPAAMRGRYRVAVEDLLTLEITSQGLGFTERRGYRLVSRNGWTVLTDVMRVQAPARLAYWGARLTFGPDPRAEALRKVAGGDRETYVQTLSHGPGVVTFDGPRVWPEGRKVTPLDCR